MKKIAVLILLIISITTRANAQEQPTKKNVADNFFERYEYAKAVVIYLELAAKNNPKIQVVERIADCYRLMDDYDNAELWYQTATNYPDAAIIDYYYYAEILLRNKKFKEAKEQYKQYYGKTENAGQLQFKLAACDSAATWVKLTGGYTIKNEHRFNSKYSDWGLNYLGKTDFIFISDRKVNDKKNAVYERNGNGYFKLYQSDVDTAVLFPINTKGSAFFDGQYNIGPMVFNTPQDTAYITITTTVPKHALPTDKKDKGSTQLLYTRRLQLIMATKTNGQWGNFVSFPYNNINKYSVGNATLSKAGDVIYFTSDMPGGEGKTDIWYCVKQSNGSWDKPVNCGKTINTKQDESFPIINSDGALYFSSNGLPGMGGLDIFKAKGEKDNWSKPKNLKYPVNSTSDDFYYVTRDGLSGFFSSNREGGRGSDDIYSFSYTPPEVVVAAPKIVAKAVQPVQQPIIKNPILNLKKGESLVLQNIYYDLNKSNIRPDAAVELDKLAAILKDHPTIRLELSSHTDSRAPAAYNMALSNRRAASAVAYLVKQGISASRLVPKGYGDTRLLNQCVKGVHCTEAEHQLNRRTEVKILSE